MGVTDYTVAPEPPVVVTAQRPTTVTIAQGFHGTIHVRPSPHTVTIVVAGCPEQEGP